VNDRDKAVVFFLSGFVTEEIPTDLEIRILVKKFPALELRDYAGSHYRQFQLAVDKVLRRIKH
jgi:hypothetical protein